MKLTIDSVVQRSEGVVTAPVQHELVLMSVERGQYFGTGSVGAWLWEHLERPAPVADLCRGLQERYQVEPEVCAHDVLGFLQDLLEQGLLTVQR